MPTLLAYGRSVLEEENQEHYEDWSFLMFNPTHNKMPQMVSSEGITYLQDCTLPGNDGNSSGSKLPTTRTPRAYTRNHVGPTGWAGG